MDELAVRESLPLIRTALAEDVGPGDITTQATVPAAATGQGLIVAREPLVAAGLAVATAVFYEVSPRLEVKRLAEDGQRLNAGQGLLRVRGPVAPLLTAERVALNFLQRLTGVATLTRQYVDAVEGTAAIILDTRKTTPGLRALEKHAVRCGGGLNHRLGLADGVLVKDNHLLSARSIGDAVASLRAATTLPIEIECDTLAQVEEALAAGADALLLDNMPLDDLRRAVALARGRLEASGGITLDTVRAVAETGVDEISVGALTHSARSLDVSLEVT
jgi:nicotinate-nucleotide pyrophosphorylase (carboxylating)